MAVSAGRGVESALPELSVVLKWGFVVAVVVWWCAVGGGPCV